MSVRKYLILFRRLKFVLRGIKTLLEGQLTVDVLDGASIGACLLQRNYKTAGTVMFLLNNSGLLESYTRSRTRAVLADSLAVKTDKPESQKSERNYAVRKLFGAALHSRL